MQIIKLTESQIKLENKQKALEYENNRLHGIVDYVAMMTDVEIPTDNTEAGNAH